MAQTIIEQTMLRAPELLVQNRRPTSPVRCAIPRTVCFSHLFRGNAGTGSNCSVSMANGTFTADGAAPTGLLDDIDAVFAATTGTGPFTLLLEIYKHQIASGFEYILGNGSFAIASVHQSAGWKWAIYTGSVLTSSGATQLSAPNTYRFGISRSDNSKVLRTALNGTDTGTVTHTEAVFNLNSLVFNSYTNSGGYGESAGVKYKACVITTADTPSGLLAEYTRDSAAWWKPL